MSTTAGVNRSADLPDGLHVYMCGSGSPLADPNRAGPCIGVLAGQKAFVFDVGAGSVRNLGLMGFPIAQLDRVYITHLHSDHIAGLGELMLNAWIGGSRDTPLPVIGPAGINRVVQGFTTAYQIDRNFRIAHHGTGVANPDGYGAAATAIPDSNEGVEAFVELYNDGDLIISAITVEHEPVSPAYGYRIDYKDRSISISGDTTYSQNFVTHSQNVDLMFHEALNIEMVSTIQKTLAERGLENPATIFADIPDYHSTPKDAARVASEAGATGLVLYHIVPALPLELLDAVFLKGVSDEYDGEVTLGKDGMIFSLPAGSTRILSLIHI